MHIAALQRLSLLDFPNKMCCIVFTAGCNLRCPFCHNAGLVLSSPAPLPAMPESEFFGFLQKRKGVLEGVCISGGEPLLHPDLPEFIAKIKAMGFAVKLDTNGFFPSRLAPLLKDGLLDYVALDIKNSPEKYPVTCGLDSSADYNSSADSVINTFHPDYNSFMNACNSTAQNSDCNSVEHNPVSDCNATKSIAPADYSLVKESARIIMEIGVDYELRTTLVRELHDYSDLEKMGKQFSGAKRYFLQTFVDSGATIKSGLNPLSNDEMQKALGILQKYVPNAKIR